MQVRAIIEAAIDCRRRNVTVLPEIMIPLTIAAKELQIVTDRVRAVADAILAEAGESLSYLVGTMIETPRAAICADQIAQVADFFSFGTNDLTQLALGLSRDDAGKFLPEYVDEDKFAIFPDHPFQSLDPDGVGMLVKWGIDRGRSANPKLKIGICGEHAGELQSVKLCHSFGMDYVSCSPYRVPIARLGAAQATLQDADEKRAARVGARRPAVKKAASKKKVGAKKKTAKKKVGAKRKTTKKKVGAKKKTVTKKGKPKRAPKAAKKTVNKKPAGKKRARKQTGTKKKAGKKTTKKRVAKKKTVKRKPSGKKAKRARR
jgi:pyruvate,orthophosphate dikinase